MQHQTALLLFRLRRHEPHRRPRDRLADGSSVVGIVLAAFEIGLHVARRQQPYRVAERLKLAAPMMCGRTRLNPHEAGRQRREELQQLRSANALSDYYRALSVHAVNLKNQLRDIETNRANLAHGRLPSTWFVSTQPPYGTLMPQSGRRPQHQSQMRSRSHDRACPLRLSKRTICTPSQRVRLVPRVDQSRCSKTNGLFD